MRVRVRFSKVGKIRWTSHRDVARMWERAFRREQLALAYSEGFSPRPKVSFGLALPTGHESVAEYLDIELLDGVDQPDPTALATRLSGALPVGVDATAAAVIPPGTPSLQEVVTSCTWHFAARTRDGGPVADPAEVDARVATLLDASEAVITRSRKGVEVREDVRPGILALRHLGDGVLEAELATQPRGMRPSEVLTALGGDVVEGDVRRLHQWISRDGARHEPLDGFAAATDAPHALERAS